MPIPTGGLVTKLDFSDPACYSGTGNTVYDLVGNNDFAIISSPTFVEYGQQSYFQFTASLNKLQTINTVDVTSITVFTFSVWAMSTGGSSAIQVVFGSGLNGPAGGVPHIALNVAAPNVVNSTFGYGVSNAVGSAINQNQWYLLTMTCDGTTNKIYVNGTLAGSAPRGTGSIGVDPTNLVIGQYSDVENSLPWIGRVGAYYYYDTALSATDVQNLYNSTYSRFTGNLITKYDFQNSATYPGSGNTVYDIEGNVNLEIANAHWVSGTTNYFDLQGDTNLFNPSPGSPFADSTFTINCWYYPNFTNPSTYATVWALGTDGNGTRPMLATQSDGTMNIQWSFGFGLVPYTPTIDWHLFTFVSTGTGNSTSLYVDGQFIGTNATAGTVAGGGFIRLGAGTNGSGGVWEFAYGRIGYWDYYSDALSPAQILDIYNNTSAPYIPAPPAYQGIVGGRQFNQGFNG